MRLSAYLLMGSVAFAAAAACGPSQPANTADDGSSGEKIVPTASADAAGAGAATPEAGGGASASGGAATGGATAGEGGGTAGAGGGAAAPATLAALVAAAAPADGAKLFDQEHCNGCHGTKAKPPAKFPNLFKIDWKDATIEKAFALVKKGKTPMPGYGDKLDDKQIAAIIAFVKAK